MDSPQVEDAAGGRAGIVLAWDRPSHFVVCLASFHPERPTDDKTRSSVPLRLASTQKDQPERRRHKQQCQHHSGPAVPKVQGIADAEALFDQDRRICGIDVKEAPSPTGIGRTVAHRGGPRGDPALAVVFRSSVQPYVISWFHYDPAREIARLKMPVLIQQGTTDIQVSVGDAELLAKANPAAKLVLIEGMNHVLKEVPAEREKQLASYSDPSLPLAGKLVDEIASLIHGLKVAK